jgi:lambda family phage portal protein
MKPVQGEGFTIELNRTPVLFDADGREIQAQSPWGANAGVVVSRANSGFLVGGTGYAQHGASFRRRALAAWLPYPGSADTDIVRNQHVLRARSRDLYMSFPVGKAAIDTKTNNIIGTGVRPIPNPDAEVLEITPEEAADIGKQILSNWRMYMEDEACDWERNHNVYAKQAEIYKTKEMSGDAPLFFAYRDDGKLPFSLKLRTIDPDRLCNPFQIPVPTQQQNVWGGVELKKYNGPTVAYWIAQFHPLDYGLLPQISEQRWERVPVFSDDYLTRNALLHYNVERPQQRRGVPALATCFELAKGCQRFVNEKIGKEVISNFFSVFVKSPMPTEDIFREFEPEEIRQFYKVFPYDITMSPGGAVFGKPGDSIEIIKGDAGGSDFSSFSQYNFMIICAAIQVPYSIVMKKFEASYSASRAELEEFYQRTVQVERQQHIDQVDQPIYESFIGELILNKTLKMKMPNRYFRDFNFRKALSRCIWTGIGQGSIDPLKDVQAAMLRVQLGISTVQREAMLMNGTDWEDNAAQIAKEQKVFTDLGLTYLAFPGMENIVRQKVGAGEATEGTQVTQPTGQPGTKGEPDTGEQPSSAPTPKQTQNV